MNIFTDQLPPPIFTRTIIKPKYNKNKNDDENKMVDIEPNIEPVEKTVMMEDIEEEQTTKTKKIKTK